MALSTTGMDTWLRHSNPLVTFTRRRPDGALSRGMGFVYDLLPSGRAVLCTCRHHFLEVENLSSWVLLGGFNRDEQYTPLHTTPFYAPDDRDICFIVADRVINTQRLKLFDSTTYDKWRATKEGILYNCRNAIGENPDSQLWIARQIIGPPRDPTHRVWISIHDQEKAHMLPETDTVELPELRSRGYHEHGYMCMYTRPGFSGSPIWDDRLRLVGMNVRGTYGGDDGDYCGYVYAGDICRAFQVIQPQILKLDRLPR